MYFSFQGKLNETGVFPTELMNVNLKVYDPVNCDKYAGYYTEYYKTEICAGNFFYRLRFMKIFFFVISI